MADLSEAESGSGGETEGGRTYTVQSGDTLSKISKHFYGDAEKHMDIYYANRDEIENPDQLRVGQVLNIPDAG